MSGPFTRPVASTNHGYTLVVIDWGRSQQRRQELTRPKAHRNGARWTEGETAVALDPTLTTVQAALQLGRSAYAVRDRRKQARRAAIKQAKGEQRAPTTHTRHPMTTADKPATPRSP